MISMMLTPLTLHIYLQLTVCTAPQEAVSCCHFIFQMYKCAHIFINVKVKVMWTLKQFMKTQKGSRHIALLFL